MMLTALCIIPALFSGYVIGIPILWLVRKGLPLTRSDWLWAPYLGVGTIVLTIGQLVYLDITVAQSTIWLWSAAILAWIVLIVRFGWRTPFQNCPWWVLLVTCIVYLAQGAGMLRLGVERYSGRAYTDRFNYVSLSQFVIDAPFSLTWDGLEQRAYLADGLKVKNERIGIASFQGFLACTLRVPSAETFDPTMLLGPALVVPAIVALALRFSFSYRNSLLIGATSALLPGLATLQLSSFLGHVVGIPFLISSAIAAGSLAGNWTYRRLILTAFLFAATCDIYTEFTPLLLAILGGSVLTGLWLGTLRVKAALLLFAGVLLATSAFYPEFFLQSQHHCVTRTAANTTHSGMPLTWLAGTNEYGAIWISDQAALDRSQPRRGLTIGFGILATIVSLLGLTRNAWIVVRNRRETSIQSPERSVLSILAAAIALGPFVLLPFAKFEYQTVKLLLTISPIWVLGLALELRRFESLRMAGGSTFSSRLWQRVPAVHCNLAALSLSLGLATIYLTYAVGKPGFVRYSLHSNLLEPSIFEVRTHLEQYREEAVVLACGSGTIGNSYLSYAARQNRVWLVNPTINDKAAIGGGRVDIPETKPCAKGRQLVDLQAVPPGAIVVLRNDDERQVEIEGESKLLWESGVFQAWQVGPGPFRLIPTEKAARPKDLDKPANTRAARLP